MRKAAYETIDRVHLRNVKIRHKNQLILISFNIVQNRNKYTYVCFICVLGLKTILVKIRSPDRTANPAVNALSKKGQKNKTPQNERKNKTIN